MDNLDDDSIIQQISQFLDPFSTYQWGLATNNDKIVKLLIHRVLPSNLRIHIANTISTRAASEEEIWRRKRDLIMNLCYRGWRDPRQAPWRWSMDFDRDERNAITRWMGEAFMSSTNPAFILHFLQEFANITVCRIEHERHFTVLMSDCQRTASEYFNIRAWFPLEKTFPITLLTNYEISATLLEVATMKFEERGFVDYFSDDMPSHDKQVQQAKENVETHLRSLPVEKMWIRWCLEEEDFQTGYDPDEFVDTTSDTEWEEWLGSLPYQRFESRNRSEEEIDALGSSIRSTLQTFLKCLPSISPQEDVPPLKLCPIAFRKICWRLFHDYKTHCELSLSALNFLQRVVEDLIFCPVLSFEVDHPNVACRLGCNLLLGEHVTMFSLFDKQECWVEDDSDFEMDEED